MYPPTLRELLLIACFGAAGALARYGVWLGCQVFFNDYLGSKMAWGTLTVNLVGCFLLAALAEIADADIGITPEWRTALGVGLLGALTTFSTFGVETIGFVHKGHYLHAAANVGLNLIGGLAMVAAGVAVARWLTD